MYTTMWTYLWDLVDDGLDEAVTRLREQVGLDAISIATAYHTYQQLRPHRPGAKLLTQDTAAVYFQPDPALYEDTVIEPYIAPLVEQAGNPMAQLADVSQRVGLDLISWTVCLHNTHLARSYPHLAQQTAYGDNLGWILCPGCPDVRQYVLALCRDLVANYGMRRIELETCNFGGYGHNHYHVKDGVPLGNVGRYLYSLSFSDGCCAAARERDIDVDGLQQWVREQLNPVFTNATPLDGDIANVVAANPDLAAFQALREELVASLAGEIQAACPGTEISFLLMGDRWTAGIRPDLLAPHVDRMGILAYTDDPSKVQDRVQAELQRGVPSADRMVAGVCAYPPTSPDADTLAAVCGAAHEAGVRELSFYNYGIMPDACFDWVRHCIDSNR